MTEKKKYCFSRNWIKIFSAITNIDYGNLSL